MKISVKDISKSYDRNNKVLDSLSLDIESGSLTTLLGLSGCGKTTFLRILSGLEKPDTGSILFGEKTIFDKEKKIDVAPFDRNLSFVFQDFALWPNMTVLENVMFALRNRRPKKNIVSFFHDGKKDKKYLIDRSMEALRMVKMEDYCKRRPDELSGGQKQRVSIARAIVISPDVILFDEPLSALDALLRQEMRAEIKSLVKTLKITAVFVTHDQEEAMAISDKIVILNRGRIEEVGTPEEIYWHPKKRFVSHFIGKSTFLDDRHFLRPEDLTQEVQNSRIDLQVLRCTYEGGRYLIQGEDKKGKECLFYSDIPYSTGTYLVRYFSMDSVREVE